MTLRRVALAGPVRLDVLAADLDDPVPAGAEAISGGSPVTHLVRGWRRRGVEVVVATLAHGVAAPTVLRGDGLTVHVGPYRPAHRARDAFRAEREAVAAALAGSGADVAHAHWTYEFALGALASGLPSVVTVRDWAPAILRHHPHPYRVVRLGMAAAVLRRADHVTVTSPYLEARVRRVTRRPPALVPNAVDDAEVLDLDAVAPRPRDPDAPVLVSVNNGWGHRKNVATLLQAFALVRAERPHATLRLVGSGHGPGQEAEAWAGPRGLLDGVELVGALPHPAAMAAVADADLLVHPSREESFGLTLVEAMVRGVPVVAGAGAGAVPWVADDGRAAVLVDVGSPPALAAGVARVLDDVAATRARTVHAHAHARARFTVDAVLDRYAEVYERATVEGPRRAR
ncbi:MAG: glycosyltransferase family 4 protein [Actinomycetes bacterium]